MSARTHNPALSVPGAMPALVNLAQAAQGGLPTQLRDLINLRASQINRCSVCVISHSRDLKKAGETDDRLWAVGAWRDVPYFTDAERAVLALTEAATRLSDRADPVPDAIWREAARHYDEATLGRVVLSIGLINLWNRLNVVTAQVGGQTW